MKKNILYVGSTGTSGYAIATKNFIFNHLMSGNNVTYLPVDVDNTQKNDNDPISINVKSCVNKFYDYYDYFICNFIPTLFEPQYNDVKKYINNPNCKKILQTVWETTKISNDWLPYLNNPLCDEIWLPSKFNKNVFEQSEVTTPIKVKKYVSYNIINTIDKKDIGLPFHFRYGNADITKTFNFYYIGTWNERKNNIGTLRTFCETFSKEDNVSLLIKSNYYMYQDSYTNEIKTELEKVLSEYPNHPTILLFPDNYPISTLNLIHNLGDCYFLLHRGEGLGLSSYDAYLNHKPVIVTGFGGHTEYFSDNYPYLVDYKLIDVSKTFPFPFYQHDHQWAEPDYNHAKNLLRLVYEKYR
jgi:hypothetical protein